MLKLGITGGIGSGKSLVCKILESFGIPVFRADDEGRKLITTDSEMGAELKKIFGSLFLTGGKPDPKKIAAIVFADSGKLAALNAIIHPAVRLAFAKWCTLQQNSACVAEEAAILFESGAYKYLDRIALVIAPEELRIKRVMLRDNLNESEVRERMQYQWSDSEKEKRADFVITNNDNTMLIPQVVSMLKKISGENPNIKL